MLTRVFNVFGSIVRIAELKTYLLAFAAKRSVVAMLGCFVAVIVAFGGLSILLGAGYVALQAIVGVPVAMTIVGVFLLVVASLIWVVAKRHGKGTGQDMTEEETQKQATREGDELRSLLGMSNDDSKPGSERDGSGGYSSAQSEAIKGLENPKIAVAAGFALLGLLGPGRFFRTIRIATALGSVAALANRAINEHLDKSTDEQEALTSQDSSNHKPSAERHAPDHSPGPNPSVRDVQPGELQEDAVLGRAATCR